MIPAAKPKLPKAEALLPYLRQIDANRYYTNFGPLVRSLEDRFAAWMGIEAEHLVTASNGTTALELAIAAHNPQAGHYVIMPAWTFIATAHSVLSAGLIPFFADVDPVSWALTPAIAEEALQACPGPVAMVMAVAPFGLPLPIKQWEEFSKKTGLQIVIDGAAMSPEDIEVSEIVTTTLSLHATKLLSAGEGGLILQKNEAVINRARELSNFDLTAQGVRMASSNKKMSEYHAAVALASMDEWAEIKHDFMRVASRYRRNLQGQAGVKLRPGFGEHLFSALCIIETERVLDSAALEALGIGSRLNWRAGCHKEPLFKDTPRMALPVTDYLSQRYAGIPCWRDLPDQDIDGICEKIIKYVQA